MVPRLTIHKQKRKFFALVSVSLCLLLPPPTFLKMTLNCLRSSSSHSFDCKRQWRPIVQSVWLRKPGEKWRPKPRKRQKNRELQRRRRSWSTSNNSWTRCERKRPPYWRCCDDHLSQGQMITQGVNLLVRISSGKFTRELDKESLLNQCPIYTNVSWSVLPLPKPALQSMLCPHVCLTPYSRPPCVLQVP